jgi:hypothetical protein
MHGESSLFAYCSLIARDVPMPLGISVNACPDADVSKICTEYVCASSENIGMGRLKTMKKRRNIIEQCY